jgi:hypothetical protein
MALPIPVCEMYVLTAKDTFFAIRTLGLAKAGDPTTK